MSTIRTRLAAVAQRQFSAAPRRHTPHTTARPVHGRNRTHRDAAPEAAHHVPPVLLSIR